MAPDRGSVDNRNHMDGHSDAASVLSSRAQQPQNFTLRSLLLGLAIGTVICFSNTYFGLQTGWVSSMAMPSALLGFAWFKAVSRTLSYPFTPVENVLVQSVAGSVGTMPLGCGFVGVIPALEYLLKPQETQGEGTGVHLSLGKLIVWAVGICFFGVVFAVPLRRQVIIREKLKFPSGTATALMIGVLHGGEKDATIIHMDNDDGQQNANTQAEQVEEEERRLIENAQTQRRRQQETTASESQADVEALDKDHLADWKARIKLLTLSFGLSAIYTLMSYFVPFIRDIPFLGMYLAKDWLWTLNPSPAYIGQGIIMGPATTLHMLLGAILGWGILSPLSKARGWAPGAVDDWEKGSKGWIVWVSLAIMLADSIVSLGWLVLRPTIQLIRVFGPRAKDSVARGTWKEDLRNFAHPHMRGYSPVNLNEPDHESPETDGLISGATQSKKTAQDAPEPDAPPEHLISNKVTLIGLVLSLTACVGAVHFAFANLIPFALTLLSLVLALLLSIMGVRALGETDLNPVSGISKLTQLFFALVTPSGSPNAVIVNLIAGAISESGALQAGDLLQDLKTGHLLGASPKAQFWGQILGSTFGAVISACIYKLYTRVYEVPGGMFQVPTAYVWVFTARLVTGQGLPPMVGEWAAGAAAVFAVFTAMRIYGNSIGAKWTPFVPGGIAVAVVSIIQQCNYIANWHDLRIQQYEQSIIVKGNPALALGPLSRGFNAVLFWTILYFYNVDSITMLFWAIALVFSVWNIRPRWLQRWQGVISWVSKVLAVVLPAIFSALRKGFQVNAGFIGTLILMNLLMLVSFAFGAVCVILILFKYLRAKIGFDSYASASASKSYAAGSVAAVETTTSRVGRPAPRGLRTRVDGWLVVRFTIAFLILSGFEIFLISFEINRYHKTKHAKIAGAPDFGVRASVVDVLNYLPGVTASLLAFLLFGTTAQQRAMYAPMLAALHPARWRRRPKSARFSGNVDQWRRMDTDGSRPSQQTIHGDIEMQMPMRKDKVTRTIVTTVESEEVLFSPPPIPKDTRGHVAVLDDRDKRRLTR
ncbi:oligopeptide transporter-like protein, partial [Aureobasidium melanogenum]